MRAIPAATFAASLALQAGAATAVAVAHVANPVECIAPGEPRIAR